jgi:uncharacterized membrane protein
MPVVDCCNVFDRRARRRVRPLVLLRSARSASPTPSLMEIAGDSPRGVFRTSSNRYSADPSALVRKMLLSTLPMDAESFYDRSTSLADAENWLALGAGVLILLVGASRRSAVGACLAVSSAPLLYRGITGRWPAALDGHGQRDNTKTALGGERGVHVRESVRLEVPVADVYRFWRRLENLPRFMTHLNRVIENSDGRSHWVAAGPAGLAVEWDAEIINEIENKVLAWRSLPGSEVVTAGSVSFDAARGGRGTQVSVHLQYAPAAGRAGALIASFFGREPSQTIREDLRHFKQLFEAGEIPRATATA